MKTVFQNLNVIGFIMLVIGILLIGMTSYGFIGNLLVLGGLVLYVGHSIFTLFHWKSNTTETNIMSIAGVVLGIVLILIKIVWRG
ncbi:MAG: hypothetical protein IJ527_04430 [Prevotella sp.]|nr:hypothetical protein [Prevotella sp.]